MGCRTVTPADLSKFEWPRPELLAKMMEIDPSAASEEEKAKKGVGQVRYLSFLDQLSSTASLGFRIDAAKTVVDKELDTLPLPSGHTFETLKSEANVESALCAFLQDDYALCKAVIGKLEAVAAALERSEFFAKHVMLRSTLLLVYDDVAHAKMELKMLNFGSCYPAPDGAKASHEGLTWGGTAESHEDGYLTGVRSILRILKDQEKQMELRAIKGKSRRISHGFSPTARASVPAQRNTSRTTSLTVSEGDTAYSA